TPRTRGCPGYARGSPPRRGRLAPHSRWSPGEPRRRPAAPSRSRAARTRVAPEGERGLPGKHRRGPGFLHPRGGRAGDGPGQAASSSFPLHHGAGGESVEAGDARVLHTLLRASGGLVPVSVTYMSAILASCAIKSADTKRVTAISLCRPSKLLRGRPALVH